MIAPSGRIRNPAPNTANVSISDANRHPDLGYEQIPPRVRTRAIHLLIDQLGVQVGCSDGGIVTDFEPVNVTLLPAACATTLNPLTVWLAALMALAIRVARSDPLSLNKYEIRTLPLAGLTRPVEVFRLTI